MVTLMEFPTVVAFSVTVEVPITLSDITGTLFEERVKRKDSGFPDTGEISPVIAPMLLSEHLYSDVSL